MRGYHCRAECSETKDYEDCAYYLIPFQFEWLSGGDFEEEKEKGGKKRKHEGKCIRDLSDPIFVRDSVPCYSFYFLPGPRDFASAMLCCFVCTRALERTSVFASVDRG